MNIKTGIVLTDGHAPYQDKKVINVVSKFIKEIKPDEIVFLGDMLNYAPYSRHGKRFNESPYEQIAEEHIACNLMLDELLPKQKLSLVWLDGNHERNQDLYFTENPDTYDEAVHRYNKLSLKKRGFKIILPYGDIYTNGKLNFTHAWRAGINAVRSHLIQDFHASFVMGHIHRSDIATCNNIERKPMQGYSVGCLCKPDWNYTMSRNSNHGLGVYYIAPNGNFSFYNVVIVDNQFMFDGVLWKP